MCKWVLLPDKENPTERLCQEEGSPYCEEHMAEVLYTWNELAEYVKTSSASPTAPI